MHFVCDACQCKYSINDDKIRSESFKIRCNRCNHIILVRREHNGTSIRSGSVICADLDQKVAPRRQFRRIFSVNSPTETKKLAPRTNLIDPPERLQKKYGSRIAIASFALALSFTLPNTARAQPCGLGPIWLSSSPSRINFSVETEQCEGKVASKTIYLIGHGTDEANIYGISWQPEIPSPPFYTTSWQVNSGLRPTESREGTVDFYARTAGSFFGAMVVEYGYSINALSKMRACLNDLHGTNIIRLQHLLEDLQRDGPDFSEAATQETRAKLIATAKYNELDAKKSQAEKRAMALALEKERALRDIDLGLFCSQCSRSRTQIEREDKKSFEEHLIDVRGHAVPGDPKVRAETIRKYDDLIDAAKAEAAIIAQQIDDLRSDLQKRYDEIKTKKIELLTAFREKEKYLKQQIDDAKGQWRQAMDVFSREFNNKRWWLRVIIDGTCREEEVTDPPAKPGAFR